MNKHTKEAIYEAYSLEVETRRNLVSELNLERRHNAGLRFDAQYWQDAWLGEMVRKHVKIVGDMGDTLTEYFAHPRRFLLTTKNKGFYAVTDEGDHFFIWFAWTNPDAWGSERRSMSNLIKELAAYNKPIRYTGVTNVMKTHSKEIAEGLYELVL